MRAPLWIIVPVLLAGVCQAQEQEPDHLRSQAGAVDLLSPSQVQFPRLFYASPDRTFTADGWTESLGSEYPYEGNLIYHHASDTLSVLAYRPSMDLAAFAEDLPSVSIKQIAIRTEIYELDKLEALDLVESSAGRDDHSRERTAALGAVRARSAKLIATHSIITTNRQRTRLRDVETEYQKSSPERMRGTILEAEPEIDYDDDTNRDIDLIIALEHHPAAARASSKTIQADVSLRDGGYLILANWSAGGDRSLIAFVTANIQFVYR